MRRRRGRVTLRERLESSWRTRSFYAAAFDKPAPEKPQALQDIEARAGIRRQRSTPGADGKPLEKNVLKAVMSALRIDPRVASVERNQSGVFQEGDRFIRVGSKGKLDLTVYLKTGKFAEIEVKRQKKESLLSDAQRNRINAIRSSGGIAGWCWDIPSALAILP